MTKPTKKRSKSSKKSSGGKKGRKGRRTSRGELWSNNTVQFTRLLAEMKMAGIPTVKQMEDLCTSMDLQFDDVHELMDRAEEAWEAIKARGYLFKTQMRWGEVEAPGERPVTEHTFNSLEELNAFNEAVIEGDGWLSGEQVTECGKHDGHFHPIDEECDKCLEECEECGDGG